MFQVNTIVLAHVLDYLPTLPPGQVNCLVTSPPYYRQRDYGTPGQRWSDEYLGELGQESTVDAYIAHLVQVFEAARPALHPTATVWVNLGDTYIDKQLQLIPARFALAMQARGWIVRNEILWNKINALPESVTDRLMQRHEQIYLFTLQPEGYWFDVDVLRQPHQLSSKLRAMRGRSQQNKYDQRGASSANLSKAREHVGYEDMESRIAAGETTLNRQGAMKKAIWTEGQWLPLVQGLLARVEPLLARDTWENLLDEVAAWLVTPGDVLDISTKSNSSRHTAAFPHDLIEPMILAGCPARVCDQCGDPYRRDRHCECTGHWRPGLVLDPFMGSGTTALTALATGRDFTGCELNPDFLEAAMERLTGQAYSEAEREKLHRGGMLPLF